MEFTRLDISDTEGINRMSKMATEIVREHYDPILGKEQNDYMLQMFQSPQAVSEQLSHGYNYYFACENGEVVGFLAFYPRGSAMFLSKLYLYKNQRKKGYSRQMLNFVIQAAKNAGLNSVELNVNKNNDAVFAYEKLGLKRIGSEKNDIGSGFYMDDYVYSISF